MNWADICKPSISMQERTDLIHGATNELEHLEIRARTNKIALLKLAKVSVLIYGAPIAFFVALSPPFAVIVVAGLVGAIALIFIFKIVTKKLKPIRQFNRFDHEIKNSINILNLNKTDLTSNQFNNCFERLNKIITDYNNYNNVDLNSNINMLNTSIQKDLNLIDACKKGNASSLFCELKPFEQPSPAIALSICFEILERANSRLDVDYMLARLIALQSFSDNIDKIPLLYFTTLIEKGNRAAELLSPLASNFNLTSDEHFELFSKIVEKSLHTTFALPERIIFPDLTSKTVDERLGFYDKILRHPPSAEVVANNPSRLNLIGTSPDQRLEIYRRLVRHGLKEEHLNQLNWREIPAEDCVKFYLDFKGQSAIEGLVLDKMQEFQLFEFYEKIANDCPSEKTFNTLRSTLSSNKSLQLSFDKFMAGKPNAEYLASLETANLSSSEWLELALLVFDSPPARSSSVIAVDHMLSEILPTIVTKLTVKDLLTLFNPEQKNLTPVLSANRSANFFGLKNTAALNQLYIESCSPALSRFGRLNKHSSSDLEPFLSMLATKTEGNGCYLLQDEISTLMKIIDDDPKLQLLIPIIKNKQEEIQKKKELDAAKIKPESSKPKIAAADEFTIYMHWVCYVSAILSTLPEDRVQRFHAHADRKSQAQLLATISSQELNKTSICRLLDDAQYVMMNQYVRQLWSMAPQI